ncbi:MAG: VIT1/CCC1 transporter family protein [Candidatus Thermoplasmatota archaeon]
MALQEQAMSNSSRLGESLRRWRLYAEVSEVGEIARRYFVMNAFDGALTTLGVVIGAYIAGRLDPLIIILAGLSGAIAMSISGFSGAYLTEAAERGRELKELERALLKPLKDTVQSRATHFATFLTAIVDALSPFLSSLLVLAPFIAAEVLPIPPDVAFYASITMTLIVMVILGSYLARISGQGVLRYGAKMLAVGVITAALCILVAVLLGGGV